MASDENASDGYAELDESRLTEEQREALARDARLGSLVEEALASASRGGKINAILGAIGAFASDPGDCEAHDMITTGLNALVAKNPRACATVHSWYIQQRDGDPTRDTIPIQELASAVEKTVHLHRSSTPTQIPGSSVLMREFAAYIEARFGDSKGPGGEIPSAAELEELISKHTQRRARGRRTTAGIVAHIVNRGRLFNVHEGHSDSDILSRVHSALARGQKAERKLREGVRS